MALAEEMGRALWFVALDDDAAWLDQINERFVGCEDLRMAGGTSQVQDVRRLVAENGADIILVDHGLAGESGVVVAGALAKQLPAVRVYVMAESPTRVLWEDARRRGVRGVIRKPFTPDGLVRRIREDMDAEARQTDALEEAPAAAYGANVPAGIRAPGIEPPRTIAVFSFKGGVGKSLVAANLAVAAASPASRQRRQVALVDAEEGVGTLPTLLGVVGRPTLLDWSEYDGERGVDPAIAMRKLGQLKCGLHCVFAPGDLERTVSGSLITTVLTTLRGMFSLVVVDCAPQVTPAVLAVLQQCTTLLLVVEPTLDCLDKVRRGVSALEAAGIGLAKLRVLVNQNRPGAGDYTPAEVREALGLQVLGRLPFDADAKRCVNRRQPLAIASDHGPFMTALGRSLSGILPGLGRTPGERGALSGRWWRPFSRLGPPAP